MYIKPIKEIVFLIVLTYCIQFKQKNVYLFITQILFHLKKDMVQDGGIRTYNLSIVCLEFYGSTASFSRITKT